MSMLLFLLMVGYTRETSDARHADARRIMLVFYAGSACNHRLLFYKKTNDVGRLLATDG